VTRKPASISVVIPVFNERKTIREIVRRVKATPREKEIIIIDDCSTDGTRQILREFDTDPEVKVVLQMQNGGKGNALQVGFQAASKDVVIVQDADLEYDPEDYEVLLRPIDSGRADVVYGSRFLYGEHRVLYFRHSLGNKILTLMSNFFTDLNLTDMETCYKVFKREIIQNIEIESARFGFEPEITAKIAKLDLHVYEVPVRYYGRSYAEGKKITWKDGIAAVRHIFHYSLSRKKFVRDLSAIHQVMVAPPAQSDVGVDTLEAFEDARRYNSWICERVESAIGERVLEVGSGIGNIVSELLARKKVRSVVATDLSASSLATLRDRLGNDERLTTEVWNAEDPPSASLLKEKFDTIICPNVLEHIEDHEKAASHMRKLLNPNGKLVILVPANPRIYSGLDEDLGHFRRYTRAELQRVLEVAGCKVERIIDHNLVGALGWWWAGKVRGRRTLRAKDTKTFDKLVPFLKRIDSILTLPFGGVSVIAISSSEESVTRPANTGMVSQLSQTA
jgi:2-polyprenyl-3-methyl-5-hydroxy-6-metoxy-1,4-benzoquinol methylase